MRSVKLIVLCVLLAGCNLAPRYQRPCMEIPCCWRFENDGGSTCCNIRWWEELGDPILNALIVQALENNRDLKTAIWRVCEFYGRYQVATSKLFPQINLSGSAVVEKFPASSFIPPSFDPITPIYQYQFNLGYEIDFWGRVRNMSLSAYEELLAEVENRRTVVLTLVSEVSNSYIRLRGLDRELVIARATEADREEYVKLARLRFEGGLTSQIEVEQAISVLEETRAAIVMLETRISIEEDLLSVLLGEPPTCIMRGLAVNEFCLPPCIPAGLPSDLLERRPDIIAAERELIAANARIGVARAEFFPQISLVGAFGGESFKLSELFTKSARAWAIGGEFMQTIFAGGRLVGQLNSSIAVYRQLLFSYEQTILEAFREVSDALVSHKNSIELVQVEKKRVAAVAEYLKLAWLRYYNGETDYLTVLDAERQLFLAQIDLTKAQTDVFLSLVAIYKAVGGGWVWEADACLVTK
ncbi:MAG: efflux transporter outer membrane subunit [Chlamydiales bacterium]|nr:efflux transporter outer membrane subunit [Chlamydiales bacterium]